MHKVIAVLVATILVSSVPASAQSFDCDATALMRIKGTWSKRPTETVFPDRSFPESQYRQVFSRLDSMAMLFRSAYPQPIGMEAAWYGSVLDNSYIKDGPLPYQLNSLYKAYFCNSYTKKIELGHETGTWAYVYVNTFSNVFERLGDDWVIAGYPNTLFRRPKVIGKWKGMALLSPTTHIRDRGQAVVIGHQGWVPWIHLSRKQFLLSLKDRLDPRVYGDKVRIIDDYLTQNSETVLSQPAMILETTAPEDFDGKFYTEDEGGTLLFRFTSRYFKNDLPRYAPQFMVLYWRWDKDVAGLEFKRQFEENFPLDALKAMIDK